MKARLTPKIVVAWVMAGMILAVPVAPSGRMAGSEQDSQTVKSTDGALPAGQAQPPSVTIVAPSARIGDFGANNGNVWNMSEANITDIIYRHENFPIERRPAAEGTIVRGSTGSAVLGMAFWGSSSQLFPSQQYHHLIYRLKIQARSDCWTNGRVAYNRSWPDPWLDTLVTSYPFVPHIDPLNCPYGTFCIYYLDLARNNNYPKWPTWHGAANSAVPSSWLTDPVRSVAIVPNEVCVDRYGVIGVPDYFELDFVYLTGDIVAREEDGYKYTVLYDISAPGSSVVTSTLRYQQVHELRAAGQEPRCNGASFSNGTWQDFKPVARNVTQLSSTPVKPPPRDPTQDKRLYLPVIGAGVSYGEHEGYQLNFSDDFEFADGESYYLCIQADNGMSKTYSVSTAPIIRVPVSPWFGPD